VYGSFKFVFILLQAEDLATSCVSPFAITSLTFLGIDLALGLVTTLLRATECSSFSLGFTLSSLTAGVGGGEGESRSQAAERFRRWLILLDRASRLPASWFLAKTWLRSWADLRPWSALFPGSPLTSRSLSTSGSRIF